MTPPVKQKVITRAIIGCIAIFAYFLVSAKLDINNLLYQKVSREEVLEMANAEFKNSDLSNFNLKQQVSVEVNDDLLNYGQTKLNNQLPREFYPVGSWLVEWTGDVETKEGKQEAYFKVEYDFAGNLIRRQQSAPDLRRPPNFKEEAALRTALLYLYQQKRHLSF